MDPVQASEDSTTVQVCVELTSGSPSDIVILTLDPIPGSASGKFKTLYAQLD